MEFFIGFSSFFVSLLEVFEGKKGEERKEARNIRT